MIGAKVSIVYKLCVGIACATLVGFCVAGPATAQNGLGLPDAGAGIRTLNDLAARNFQAGQAAGKRTRQKLRERRQVRERRLREERVKRRRDLEQGGYLESQ